jgi:predicted metal-dependent hydrolase
VVAVEISNFYLQWIPITEAEDDNHGYMALMKNGAVVMKPDLYEADMRHHIKNLFSALAEPIFEEKLYRYSDSMGVWSKAWTIGNARKRHGSCDSNGKITFSWRIVMMSDDVMDYIIVHELAHLKRMNHSKAFSDEVAAVLSDWKERRSAHRKYSHMLRCGGWM